MENNRAPGAVKDQLNINTEELWGVLSLCASRNILASRGESAYLRWTIGGWRLFL